MLNHKAHYARLLAGASLVVTLLVFHAGPAQAQANDPRPADAANDQTPDPTPTTAASESDGGGIQDIVVTAQRREENLQRAALAVSAIGGEALVNAGVTDTQGLTRLVPSLVVQPSVGAATNFYLRGVGSFAANAFTENPIAFNFAGVYVARPAAPAGTFYDLQRVEVLKGPQGTLYGRNATGGAINVLPNPPSLGKRELDATFEVGNYSTVKASAAANIPLGSSVALRLAGQVVTHDGYLSDRYDNERGQALRASLFAKPTDKVSILLIADYFHQGGKGTGAVLVPGPLSPDAPDPDSRIGSSDPRSTASLASNFPGLINSGLVIKPQSDGFQNNRFWGLTANINVDLGSVALTVVPGYRDSRPNYLTYNAGYFGRVTEVAKQKSLEVRLASTGESPFQYVVGGYVFDEKQNDFNQFDQGPILTTQFTSAIHNKSYAFFGQGTLKLLEGLRAVGGVRYTKDDKSHQTVFLQQSFGSGSPINFGNTVSSGDVTWKAGLEYDIAPQSLVYANASTGFKSGGFFIAPLDNTFGPEKLTAFTFGSKNRFFDNKLQFNVELFYWKYRNQQINYIGPTRVTQNTVGAGLVTTNAGQSRMYGAEAELRFQPTRNDDFSVDVQYLNSKFNEFSYFAAQPTGAPPRLGCPVSLSNAFAIPAPGKVYLVNCSGMPQINAPKWTANVSYEHTFELNADLDLAFGGRSRIESGRYLSTEFLQEQYQGSYMMSDAYVTLSSKGQNWSLTAFVNNLEDKTIYGGSNQRPVIPVVFNILRPPRTFGVRAGFHF